MMFYSPNTSTMRDTYIHLGKLYILRKKKPKNQKSLETSIEEKVSAIFMSNSC